MSDYRRFNSYLYEYKNQEKSKNCGFVRVEIRSHQCKLNIHMQLEPYPFTPQFQVYGFTASSTLTSSIPLGPAKYQQGNITATYLLPEKEMSAWYGLYVQADNGQLFITTWKDIDLTTSLFSSDTPAVHAASIDEETPTLSWEMFLETYPQFQPFFDDDIHPCLKLSPKDVHTLTQWNTAIQSDPFFTYCCQNYQHFLIGRESGEDSNRFVLGIPGIYHEQERFLAGLFGYTSFKPSREQMYPQGQFGYWCRFFQ